MVLALATDWQDSDSGAELSLQTGRTVAVVLSSSYRLAGERQGAKLFLQTGRTVAVVLSSR